MRTLISGALLFMAAASARSAQPIDLDGVSIHLFFQGAGALSEDVTTVKEFGAWNFHPFGEGIEDTETFHSFLIKVAFSAPSEIFEPGVVATVRVTNDKKQVILKRDIRSLYIPATRKAHVAIWVEGHECEMLNIEVKSLSKVITKRLPFACGE